MGCFFLKQICERKSCMCAYSEDLWLGFAREAKLWAGAQCHIVASWL